MQQCFPHCLLKTVEKYHPLCRLASEKFYFRSLREKNVDPYEIQLATAPCLHSVAVRYWWGEYDEGKTMRIIAGLGPNLKKVIMIECEYVNDSARYRLQETQRRAWQEIPRVSAPTVPGSLTELYLHGHVDAGRLKVWSRTTDFSVLRSLDLAQSVNGEALEFAAANCSFPQLQELGITLAFYDRGTIQTNLPRQTVAFLTSLGPLKRLTLLGALSQDIFDCVLDCHGATLRRFYLDSVVDPPDPPNPWMLRLANLEQLQRHCPILEELACHIQRTWSDSVELQAYRTFSRFPRLQNLSLQLDVSHPSTIQATRNTTADDRRLDRYFRIPWNTGAMCGRATRLGDVRDATLNSTVDEKLARSIWHVITNSKVGLRLQSLKLVPIGTVMSSNTDELYEILIHLRCSWLMRRRERGKKIMISELGEEARLLRDCEQLEWENCRSPEPWSAFNLLRKVWPVRKGSLDWRHDWGSVPLSK